MKGMLKPINDTATGGVSLCGLSVMTGRTGESSSCVRIIRICVSYRSGISRNISDRSGRMAEQVALNSRVLLQILPLARSIMRQKRRKAQPENTVHKDMARDEFVRQIAPGVGRHLRDALEQARQMQRERSGDE